MAVEQPFLSDGVTTEEVESGALEQFLAAQSAYREGFVRYQPGGQLLPRCFRRIQPTIARMELRPDDVWVASFPKVCGAWLLLLVSIDTLYRIMSVASSDLVI